MASLRKLTKMRIINLLITKLRALWHLLFWAGAFIVLLNIFKESEGYEKIDILYTLFFILPLLVAVYTNIYLLIPALLKRQHIIAWILSMITLCFISAGINYLLFEKWIDHILPNYYFISGYDLIDLIIYSSVFLLLTTLIKLSKEWFILTRDEGEKTRTQLKQLQAQINPHFLLNSLQTIYSLSLNKSEKTPGSILQLSEILKFTLYESEDEQVTLERELEVVKDYVEMYRHRLDPIRAKIRMNITGDAEDLKIIPLLFLPFIENSFKHGLQGSEKDAYVTIDFQIMEKKLNFNIENSKGVTDPVEHQGQTEFPMPGRSSSAGHGGIGINNTRKRLKLYYKGKHDLKVMETNDIYCVKLTLELA